VDQMLTVVCIGAGSRKLAEELGMEPLARIPIDKNGLSRCVSGQLVYESDLTRVPFPFPERLARAGLMAMVAAPLQVESRVFGVLIAARRELSSFASGECEFLRQLSEHVALAANQGQIYSALQQAYDDLRQTQQTVMQQERLRALGQMASGIAHDINNALSPVSLYTEALLEDEPGISPKSRQYLETIRRAIDDVAQTVARMREFYRQQESVPFSSVDLGRLMQQVLDLTRVRWSDIPQQRGVMIHLRLDLAPRLPAVAGVEGEIREALTNLVFNAVDAMPEGGTLTLRTKAVQSPADGSVHAEVEVEDTGIGMEEEVRRRCLEPFFTTKGERGSGLGLPMVYGAMQRHNAQVELESAPGLGTIVRLVFPPSTIPYGETIQPEMPKAVSTRLRLLVVDDDPLLIKSLRDTFESDGHEVITASGGREGIEVFKAAHENGEKFAVVLTDLGMPYVDGRKVATAVKILSPSTPVVLLTGWGQRLVAEDGVPTHVDRVLSKPPRLRELRGVLAELTASLDTAVAIKDTAVAIKSGLPPTTENHADLQSQAL
jgi:signal transduction histidine kinase/DNA-binding NarL/FixJ family response regulator